MMFSQKVMPQRVNDPVAAARALRPLVAKYADQCEVEGKIAEPVMTELRKAGFFLMTAARGSGGGGATLRTYIDTVAEIGKSCASTAWSLGIVSATTSMCWSSPTLRPLLFPVGDELCCFVVSRTGVATRTDEGWLVTGAWAYGSGCMHSRWALCGVTFEDENGDTLDGGMIFLDLKCEEEVVIEMDWKVAGLSGTGSNRIKAATHFVPDSLALRDSKKPDPAEIYSRSDLEPRDYWPRELGTPLAIVPAMLGAAEGLLEAVIAKMDVRPVANWHYARQTDSELLLASLGEAAIKIESARMLIHRACDLADVTAQQRLLTQFEKAQAQAGCAHAMQLVREAGSTLMEIAGPSAFALSSPLQRLWRDLSVGSRHNTINAGLSHELYGRFLTGQASNYPLISQ